MRNLKLTGVVTICAALTIAGCQGLSEKDVGAAGAVASALPAPVVEELTVLCRQSTGLLARLDRPGVPGKVSAIGVFPKAFCAPVLATGSLPATADANAPAWLRDVLSATRAAMVIAGML